MPFQPQHGPDPKVKVLDPKLDPEQEGQEMVGVSLDSRWLNTEVSPLTSIY